MEAKQQDTTTTPNTASRKRLRQDDSDNTTPSVKQLSLEDNMPTIQSLSLEAIFHPKFENENRTDQSIRQEMKERTSQKKGYVEVSLKHSGSLLLWSGGQRYYSKNATENQFTYVGELLLRQHFYRAWHGDSTTSTPEHKYQECSTFVQEHRLTLAFEVVTAILGHHGDIPNKDFLILTAVADRSTEQFYSTSQLVQFAQKYRLPHNDTWIFDSQQAVEHLFTLYDSTRETGLAEDTVAALSDVSSHHISSMYPHTVFQGNILEGIVIRYVAYQDSKTEEQELLQTLATESQHILQLVPPERPPSFALTNCSSPSSLPPVLTTDVRQLSHDIMRTGDRDKVGSFLDTHVRDILSKSDGGNRRSVRRSPIKKSWKENFPAALQEALDGIEGDETQRILKVITTLDSVKSRVDYRIVKETSSEESQQRWLCIVHVFFDAAHQKYRRKMDAADMSLFRGFCIELGTTKPDPSKMSVDKKPASVTGEDTDCLMLKMKFLPYMVRTFGCRNGLRVLSQSGPQGFCEYAMKLMTNWGISPEGKAKWYPFFRAWGQYAHMCLKGESNEYMDPSLPKLCDSFYLDHLQHFTRLYESGKFVAAEDEVSSSSFRGLLFVIGLTQEKANQAAERISELLGGVARRQGTKSISSEDWNSVCLVRNRGMICSISVHDPLKHVRGRMKDYGDSMFGVLVGCDESAVVSLVATEDDSADHPVKKLQGMVNGWRKTRFAKTLEISDADFFGVSIDGAGNGQQGNNEVIQNQVSQLNEASNALPKQDDRSGMLVFFPTIPGSGKSALCSPDVEKELRQEIKELGKLENDGGDSLPARELIIRCGDKTKKKYWPLVKQEKAKKPSSVYITDKNTPPGAWPGVGQVCSTSRGFAVPVIPDENSLQTTTVKRAKHYPFSLHFLALCMARVIARPPKSHAGKLDQSTDLACMVVVKFFCLYRGISADDYLPTIQGKIQREGAIVSANPIRVPFFREGELPPLPSELADALRDAIRLQHEYDIKTRGDASKNDKRVQEIEQRLRGLHEKHKDFLFSLSADPSVSKQALASQLIERVAALDTPGAVLDVSAPGAVLDASGFIKLVSIDVSQAVIHSMLRRHAETNPRVAKFLEQCTNGKANRNGADNGVFKGRDFVPDTHVTMVHLSQMNQSSMRDEFGAFDGCAVDVTVIGLLWSDRIAALAVKVATETADKPGLQIPPPKNEFSHITVWHKKGVGAKESNKLPVLVESGGAERVDFDEPVVIQGKLSFWGADRG